MRQVSLDCALQLLELRQVRVQELGYLVATLKGGNGRKKGESSKGDRKAKLERAHHVYAITESTRVLRECSAPHISCGRGSSYGMSHFFTRRFRRVRVRTGCIERGKESYHRLAHECCACFSDRVRVWLLDGGRSSNGADEPYTAVASCAEDSTPAGTTDLLVVFNRRFVKQLIQLREIVNFLLHLRLVDRLINCNFTWWVNFGHRIVLFSDHLTPRGRRTATVHVEWQEFEATEARARTAIAVIAKVHECS